VVKPVSMYWLSCTDEVPTRDGPEGGGGGQGEASLARRGSGLGDVRSAKLKQRSRLPQQTLLALTDGRPDLVSL
jgi:hypothetical protein